jgi:quercetin dioxygenase-like cupin family protein
MLKKLIVCAALLALAAPVLATAQSIQPSPIKRIPLQKIDVAGTNYEAVTAIAEIVPNVNIGRHSHPGTETGYVLEGDVQLLVDGQPAKPMKVGDSWTITAGTIHDARTGEKGAKVLATYIVEKGKPLASPAP